MLETIQYKLFNHFESDIISGVTTRFGGRSTGVYDSLNLGNHVGDSLDSVNENRGILATHIQLKASKLHFFNQVHGVDVAVIDDKTYSEEVVCDAAITNTKGVGLVVLTADCVPLIFFDNQLLVIGVAHAGWKGTLGDIAKHTVLKMSETYGSDPKNVIVGIGPCISKAVYEVGEEVSDLFRAEWYSDEYLQKNPKSTKYHIDLQQINKTQLVKVGVLDSNIEIIEKCTFSNPEKLFSARRDGLKSGRMGSYIGLK